MPDLTIINDLDKAIHVAFFIAAPTHWKNNLQPGERWTTHLPTLPHHFQARWTDRSRPFCPEESREMGTAIGLTCAAGMASIITAVTSVLSGVGVPFIAGPLVVAADAGRKRYAMMMDQVEKVCETCILVPWVEHRQYSVRVVGGGQCGLWDVKENRQV